VDVPESQASGFQSTRPRVGPMSHHPSLHGHRRPPPDVIPVGKDGMALQRTLLDLVTAVSKYAASDAEVVATVVCLVNSGTVELCGNFRGARFDLASADGTTAT
jgi:hypothetical protein